MEEHTLEADPYVLHEEWIGKNKQSKRHKWYVGVDDGLEGLEADSQ